MSAAQASPEEQRSGEALIDALDRLNRARNALYAAIEVEGDAYRRAALREIEEQLFTAQRALRLLS